MINYTIPWFEYLNESDFQNRSFDKCMKCTFQYRDKGSDSTYRDLIIGSAFGNIDGILPFVRSLRTTNCKATLVVLIDDIAYSKLTENHWKQIDGCGIVFHNIGRCLFELNSGTAGLPVVRYLVSQYKYVDRVFYSNIFDVAFQGDPFTQSVTRDKVFFLF